MIDEIIEAIKSGHKILIAGNGGLAAESEHFAAELVGQFAYPVYIPCVALTANSSLLTALANDIGYEQVFAHQIEVMGNKGDVFIGMTTSHSRNIERACEWAESKGLISLLLDGDVLVGKDVAEKQEYALKYLHKLARLLKKELYDTGRKS
jgi:D-sedoheptulose 7-phosphate isomerase